MEPFRILTKIRGDIRNFVFIAGVVDTGDPVIKGIVQPKRGGGVKRGTSQ
jgi:hypothetical protein